MAQTSEYPGKTTRGGLAAPGASVGGDGFGCFVEVRVAVRIGRHEGKDPARAGQVDVGCDVDLDETSAELSIGAAVRNHRGNPAH